MHYNAIFHGWRRGSGMVEAVRKYANGAQRINFQTEPARYRHWNLAVDGEIATLTLDVDEKGGLFEGYELKLNSYDLGVDIELADALLRLRFEHPGVKAVIMRSGKPRIFCAGANIRMLAGSAHAHKVNFCKFTNETRNSIEEASEVSGIRTVCLANGAAAGGGYELALAADHIMLVDDGSSSVSLPEVPLLAVLPGTGGLTRVSDKRKVRRDRADVFCTTEEGIKGQRAIQWRLVDELVSASTMETKVRERAESLALGSKRNGPAEGVKLTPLTPTFTADRVAYEYVDIEINRAARTATVQIKGPVDSPPANAAAMITQGAKFWPLQMAREFEDAILHLRNNEFEIGVLIFKSNGSATHVLAYDALLDANKDNWFAHEILHYWKRALKRLDVTARTLVATIEPGACFVGSLAEIVFAADRSYMLIGQAEGDNRAPAAIILNGTNFGPLPMCTNLTRLQTRFIGEPETETKLRATQGEIYDGEMAEKAGLVTFALDSVDWADELRVFIEERAAFSPDALTGMEANLRFAGPETMESKIFARLTAWQNWIFQRPNAVGERGALRVYGTGERPQYDMARV